MYRPPINPGYDAIGAAIAGGLADARAAARRNRAESEEQRRYLAEQERQKRLDAIAEQERLRRTAIENAEIGVVDPTQAYDPILAAVAPVARGPRPGERAQDWIGQLPDQPVATGAPQPRRLREGVVRSGEMFIDPRAGLAYRRQAIAREDDRAERQRQITENAGRLMALDPTMTEAEAVARATGLSTADPITRAQALTQARQNLELSDEFKRREEARSNTEWGRRHAISESTTGRAMSVSRQTNAAQGIALSLADEVLTRGVAGGATPISFVRGRLRGYAKQQGWNLTEGEVQEIALRSLYAVQDQRRQHMYGPRDPNAETDWLIGGDPIATAVAGGAAQSGGGGPVTVRRTVTPGAPQATGGGARVVGAGIKREAREALRAGAQESELRTVLSGRGYSAAQVDEIIRGAN